VSVHWSRDAAFAELKNVKRKNRGVGEHGRVAPGDGPWVVAVRMFGAGGKLLAGADRAGTLAEGPSSRAAVFERHTPGQPGGRGRLRPDSGLLPPMLR